MHAIDKLIIEMAKAISSLAPNEATALNEAISEIEKDIADENQLTRDLEEPTSGEGQDVEKEPDDAEGSAN